MLSRRLAMSCPHITTSQWGRWANSNDLTTNKSSLNRQDEHQHCHKRQFQVSWTSLDISRTRKWAMYGFALEEQTLKKREQRGPDRLRYVVLEYVISTVHISAFPCWCVKAYELLSFSPGSPWTTAAMLLSGLTQHALHLFQNSCLFLVLTSPPTLLHFYLSPAVNTHIQFWFHPFSP